MIIIHTFFHEIIALPSLIQQQIMQEINDFAARLQETAKSIQECYVKNAISLQKYGDQTDTIEKQAQNAKDSYINYEKEKFYSQQAKENKVIITCTPLRAFTAISEIQGNCIDSYINVRGKNCIVRLQKPETVLVEDKYHKRSVG